MSIIEYNRLKTLFENKKDIQVYFVKLAHYVNFDGYNRKEFHCGRNVHFDDEENIYFTVEHYTEFRDYELKVNRKDIILFVPSTDKKSKKLPLYLQDIKFR